MKYPHDEFTRVAILPAIVDMSAPTLAEIAAGEDVTCDLTADGLKLPKDVETVDATPWRGPLAVERPTWPSMQGSSLTGFRFRDQAEPLWDLSILKAHAFMVVRRGIRVEVGWALDQVLETFDFRFGLRATSDSGNDALATFTVRLFISDQNDAAVVS